MTNNPLEDIELRIKQIDDLMQENAKDQLILQDIARTLENNKEKLSRNHVTDYPGMVQRDYDVIELEKNFQRRPLSDSDKIYVLKLDIDNFGSINKKYGEQKGDEVLKGSTEILEHTIRATDHISYPNTFMKGYHLHGEEKEIILFAPDDESARAAGERYRKLIESESEKRFGFKVTESIGISQWNIGKEPYGDATKRADRNMQIAKAIYGRNNIIGPDNVPEVSQKELEERINADSLRKSIEALGCEIVRDGEYYKLIPKKESLGKEQSILTNLLTAVIGYGISKQVGNGKNSGSGEAGGGEACGPGLM